MPFTVRPSNSLAISSIITRSGCPGSSPCRSFGSLLSPYRVSTVTALSLSENAWRFSGLITDLVTTTCPSGGRLGWCEPGAAMGGSCDDTPPPVEGPKVGRAAHHVGVCACLCSKTLPQVTAEASGSSSASSPLGVPAAAATASSADGPSSAVIDPVPVARLPSARPSAALAAGSAAEPTSMGAAPEASSFLVNLVLFARLPLINGSMIPSILRRKTSGT
mmetsp:Transcript_27627/g.60383  ORF Transcript_27627/g.60383 Transcript_27627/m.60383 type:complete len:220 (-) Transcript_27627:194-853(-)